MKNRGKKLELQLHCCKKKRVTIYYAVENNSYKSVFATKVRNS